MASDALKFHTVDPGQIPINVASGPANTATLASAIRTNGFESVFAELRRIVDILQPLCKASAIEPLAVGREQVAKLFSVSRATVDRWDASGLLGPIGTRKSGRKLWSLAELREWSANGMVPRAQWQAMNSARNGKK